MEVANILGKGGLELEAARRLTAIRNGKMILETKAGPQARSFKLGLEETPLCNCGLFVSLFEQALPTSTAPEDGSTGLKYFAVSRTLCVDLGLIAKRSSSSPSQAWNMDSQCIWMTLGKDGFGKKKIPVTSSIAADFGGGGGACIWGSLAEGSCSRGILAGPCRLAGTFSARRGGRGSHLSCVVRTRLQQWQNT